MYQTVSLIKVVLVLLLLGTVIMAVAQRAGPSGTTVPICVKGNGQLRMLIGMHPTCEPSEQKMTWVVGGEVTDITLGRGLIGWRLRGMNRTGWSATHVYSLEEVVTFIIRVIPKSRD